MNETLIMILKGIGILYVLWATFCGIKIVRKPLMNWYNSQSFFVRGSGPVDIFIKQIGFRLSWEGFVLVASAIVGCLGGAIYTIFAHSKTQNSSNTPNTSQQPISQQR